MSQDFILVSISRDELRAFIKEAVQEQQCQYPFKTKDSDTYLTRSDVCNLLHISHATLYRREQKGDIKAYRIGGRKLYKKSEVENSIQKINKA